MENKYKNWTDREWQEEKNRLFDKYVSDQTPQKDVELCLLYDAEFKACFEMILRDHLTPYDAMVILCKSKMAIAKQAMELLKLFPQPFNVKKDLQ